MAKKIIILENNPLPSRLRIWGAGGSHPVWRIANTLNNLLQLSLKAVEPEHLLPKINLENLNDSLFGDDNFREEAKQIIFYEYHTDNTLFYLFENPVKVSPKETHVFAFFFVIVSEDDQILENINVPEKTLLEHENIVITEITEILEVSQSKKLLQWLNYLI